MKNHILFLGLLIFLLYPFSCKNEADNKNFINHLSSVQNGLPSPYFNYYLYFKMDNDEILETNVDFLYKMYQDYYLKKYKKFKFYLEDLIDHKEVIRASNLKKYKRAGYFLNTVKGDKNILEMDINDIKENYLNAEKNQVFILKVKNIDSKKVRTILYRMFIDKYIIVFSDYGGYYTIKQIL